MFKKKSILAIIAARGGSKGVPRKNIRFAGGKPLIAWIIETAKKSKYIDRLIFSSDDDEIIKTAESYGCEVPFVRPKELAKDDSPASDVILHAMENVPGYNYVMLLQPTSPLTREQDIDGIIESIVDLNSESMITVTEPEKSPYWMFEMDDSNRLKPLMGDEYLRCRRQDLPSAFIPTGGIYISKSQWFMRNKSFYSKSTKGYKIPKERALDIDTELDLKLLEVLLRK